MLAVTRYRVPESDTEVFLTRARAALDVLSRQPGWRDGDVGRAVDDPSLWVLTSRWKGVGPYRRALGAYDVRVALAPLQAAALDEPTAFEVLTDSGSALAADAGDVRIGEAAAPTVPADVER